MIRTARIVQLSVVCKRLIGDGVLSNECSERFCIQDEQNGSKNRPLWNAKVGNGWLLKFTVNNYCLSSVRKVGSEPVERRIINSIEVFKSL